MNKAAARGKVTVRTGAGHAVFIAVMIGASALTFLRMTTVALLLPVADFALYATIVATGAFLAGPLSFGAIEGTIKDFPRLVADGNTARMLADARAIMRIATLRALVIAIPLLAAGFALTIEWARLGGLAMLVALGNAAGGLIASMQRAGGRPTTLAGGTVLRAGITFGAVSLTAFSSNLAAVVAAEIGSMLLAALISEWLFFRRGQAVQPPERATLVSSSEGRLVFLAYTAVAAPFYLDRLYVTTTMGRFAAAQYAVLALILLGASLLINTIAQRAGPDAIKRIYQGCMGSAVKRVLGWVGVTTTVWLTGVAIFALVLMEGWLPASLARYSIELRLLVPLAIAGVLLNTGLAEFLLIGLDRERAFVTSATSFLVLVLGAASAVYLLHGTLLTLMWALVACRVAYAALLTTVLTRAIRQRAAA